MFDRLRVNFLGGPIEVAQPLVYVLKQLQDVSGFTLINFRVWTDP